MAIGAIVWDKQTCQSVSEAGALPGRAGYQSWTMLRTAASHSGRSHSRCTIPCRQACHVTNAAGVHRRLVAHITKRAALDNTAQLQGQRSGGGAPEPYRLAFEALAQEA